MMRMDVARTALEHDVVTGWRRFMVAAYRAGWCAGIKRTIRRRGRRMAHQIERDELLSYELDPHWWNWRMCPLGDWEDWEEEDMHRFQPCPCCGDYLCTVTDEDLHGDCRRVVTNLGDVLRAIKEAA